MNDVPLWAQKQMAQDHKLIESLRADNERLRKENEEYKAEFEANLKAALDMVDLLTKTIQLMAETSNGRN